MFYRGRVMEDDGKKLSIFFIDKGCTEWVHPKDVFQWHPKWDLVPGNISFERTFRKLYKMLSHLLSICSIEWKSNACFKSTYFF